MCDAMMDYRIAHISTNNAMEMRAAAHEEVELRHAKENQCVREEENTIRLNGNSSNTVLSGI